MLEDEPKPKLKKGRLNNQRRSKAEAEDTPVTTAAAASASTTEAPVSTLSCGLETVGPNSPAAGAALADAASKTEASSRAMRWPDTAVAAESRMRGRISGECKKERRVKECKRLRVRGSKAPDRPPDRLIGKATRGECLVPSRHEPALEPI